MEFKATISEAKLIDDRTVAGFASVFGNVDSGYDRVWKGAFKKTIKERASRVRHLWMHEAYSPPSAVIKELKEVDAGELPDQVREQYPEVTGGLLVVREYLRTPRGDEILEGVKSGAINEMSFGYDAVKFDFEEIKGENEDRGIMVRNLRELRLWDTSDVNWGMNSATVAAKIAPMLEAYKERVDPAQYALLSQLITVAETATQPEQLLKAGRVLSARNLERLKNALDVLSEILLSAEPPEDEESEKALTEQVLRRLSIAEHDPILFAVR